MGRRIHRGVNGIITRDYPGVMARGKRRIPVVYASYLHAEAQNAHTIVTDDRAIGDLAASHLLERGFRHFGYVGYDEMFWSQRRRESFAAKLHAAGHQCHFWVQNRAPQAHQWPGERKSLAAWLARQPKPLGVMACNDDRARNVVDACQIVGLNVPEEVAVVGVDNDEFVCNLSNPALSSVALNVEEAGYGAAERLDRLMNGLHVEAGSIMVVPTAVVARRSTEAMAIEDPIVAEAVAFIRGNGNKPLQIADVLRHVTISRRALHDRFRRIMGCTVHQYIKRVRVGEIERLLVNTDYTMAEIARTLGFTSPDHIASYFRSVRGVNPFALRRQHLAP
ncbi:XylR family transcriptional regulator [Anaerobaca lacustris]|uniref:DNA-binding transcriptional regulator n=1 Tax=Anaerobaca lacustris TaxID=3044600 RepID=A0AAW6U5T4_9BACT|nr:DNA-binding transcriptional regulator [Sedimentisphaerales bacterium M17dextr]